MPVIRPTNSPSPSPQREALVERLADELGVTEGKPGEPLIFENPIGQTGKFLAVVLWSEWASVPWSQRSGLILDAYRRFDERRQGAEPRAPQLAISTGMTWDEAERNAFFPFSVAPNVHPDEVESEDVQKAMVEEGAVPTPGGVKLFFTTREAAEAAFSRLQKKLPQAHWSLNQVVAAIRDD